MKVLAINGSPNKNGSTYTAISLVTAELQSKGIETEIVHIGKGAIHGCTACGACKKLEDKKCVFDDDGVNECINKAKAADGIIIGSPVYYSGIAGSMKAFLDRLFYAGSQYLYYKPGAAVAVLRRAGGVDTFHQLNNYLNLANIIITPSYYWNVIHGTNSGEVMQDLEGVQIMQNLGRNMAWLLKVVEAGKSSVELPKPQTRVRTSFIR